MYEEDWIAVLGEELSCDREIGNVIDRYTVAVKKDSGETVGHVPKKISRMCSSFLQQGYALTAIVTGRRRCHTWYPEASHVHKAICRLF